MPRIDSIRSMGLEKHLDATADEHRGKKYADFVDMITLPKPPSVASMARIFGVSDITMGKWIDIYKEENRNA